MKKRIIQPLYIFYLLLFIQINLFAQSNFHTLKDTLLAQKCIDSSKYYHRLLKNEEAIKFINSAIKIYEDIYGKDTELLVSLYMNKSFYSLNKEINTNLANVDTCIRIISSKYGMDDVKMRQLINMKAWLYGYYSKYELGLNFLKKYLSLFKNESINDYDYSKSFDHIGFYYIKLNLSDSAIVYYKKTIELLKDIKNKEIDKVKSINIVRNSLANAYLQNGQIEEYEEVKVPIENMIKPDYFDNINAKDTLGLLDKYQYLGDNAFEHEDIYKALNYYKIYASLFKNYSRYASKDLAYAYLNIGDLLITVQEYEDGYSYYKKAEEIYKNNFKEDNRKFANCLEKEAFSLMKLTKYDESLKCYLQSINIKKQIDSTSVETAISLKNLANLFIQLGQYNAAENYFDQSIILLSNKKNTVKLNIVYSDYARLEYYKKDYNKSKFYIQKSFDICNYSNENPSKNIKLINSVINNLDLLSQINIRKYNDENNIKYIDTAIFLYDNALALIDINRERQNIYSKESYNFSFKNIFEHAIQANLIVGEKLQRESNVEKAFSFSEKTKFLELLEATKKTQALNYAGIPDSLLQKEKYFQESIAKVSKLLFENLEDDKTKAPNYLANLRLSEGNLQYKYRSFQKQLETQYPEYYRLKNISGLINLAQIKAEVKQNQNAILTYFTGDSSIYIFLIKENTTIAKEIKKDFNLEELVHSMLSSITGFKTNPALSSSFDSLALSYSNAAQQLYEKLILPVATYLPEKLIIIPDGILGYIPFEALVIEKPSTPSRYSQYHYLLKDHKISYCYSISMLNEMTQKKTYDGNVSNFCSFAPFYKGDTTSLTGIVAFSDFGRKELNPLPYSGEEAISISKLMNGKYYLAENATKSKFLNVASNSKILHLATHAQANDKMGDFCFLIFSNKIDSIEKELLYAREIYNLQLKAELVTLSACETGLGELKKGEGIISLARAFTYAGAKSIVTSLWQISDSKTKDIMISFYKNLQNGLRKDEALWKAKIDYLSKNKGEAASPFYWASFIGIGDMNALTQK